MTNHPTPVSVGGESLRDSIREALNSYRCTEMLLDDGEENEGLPLVDRLTHGGDIGPGKREIESLLDHICDNLPHPPQGEGKQQGISDDQLRSAFTLDSGGPNPFYRCKECGQIEPGLQEYLAAHWLTHRASLNAKAVAAGAISDTLAWKLTGYRPEQLGERDAAIIRARAQERWADLLVCAALASQGSGGDEGMVRPDKAHLIAVFKRALAGSDKDVGLWRGIRAVIDAYEAGDTVRNDARYRFLAERLLGVDFDYCESGKTVLLFEWPRTPVSAGCDETVDAALAASPVDGRKQP